MRVLSICTPPLECIAWMKRRRRLNNVERRAEEEEEVGFVPCCCCSDIPSGETTTGALRLCGHGPLFYTSSVLLFSPLLMLLWEL